MYITLRLCAHRPQLEPDRPVPDALSQFDEALNPDILQTVLQARQQVGDKLIDTAAIQHRARHPLRHEQAVPFAEVTRRARIACLGGLQVPPCPTGFLVFHRIDTAHPAIRLDELALPADEVITRRFRRAGQ